MNQETTTPPPLLRLPAELRNDIWAMVLQYDDIITIPSSGQASRPALLKVNKQITSEASQIHYSTNRFRAIITNKRHRGPIHWLQTIGPKNATAITSLAFQLDMRAEEAEMAKAIARSPFNFLNLQHSAKPVATMLSKITVRDLLRAGLRLQAVDFDGSGLFEGDGSDPRMRRILMPFPAEWRWELWVEFKRVTESRWLMRRVEAFDHASVESQGVEKRDG